ncbi:alpha/beta hydrolase [Streptomyces sp. NPDC007164]|uniref:alpha/beta hydrolase n=1 Tax=Streptomyces sp. NPDC007164 TaxID=3156918 RepID=UPI0033FC41F9
MPVRRPCASALALHRRLTASRLLTLHGARIHAVHPRYGDTCANDAVDACFLSGRLPSRDLTCRR